MKCTAKKTDGTPCKNWAIKGGTVCRKHGGAAKQVRAAANARLEEEKAQRALALFGQPKAVEPSQALLDLVHWTAGEVEFWRNEVRVIAEKDKTALTWGETKAEVGSEKGQFTDLTTTEAKPHIAYAMLYAAQDRLANYAAAALKAGVEERRVRLAEQQGNLVALAIGRILNALDLTAAQQRLIPVVVPRELRAIEAGGA